MSKLASFDSEAFSPDNLLAGGNVLSEKGTLLSGQNLVRGAVLGKITKGAASAGAVVGTGNGVMGAITLGPDAKVGEYVLECVEAASDAGRFSVTDPDGYRLADMTVGVAYSGDHLNFTLADGSTDFAAGAKITVTVAAGSKKYVLSLAAAVDGSQNPVSVLALDCDASSADAEALFYTAGNFAADSLTLGTGHTVATVKEALRPLAINIIQAS